MFKYQKENSLELRKKECKKLFDRNPNKIPIICEKDKKCSLTQEPNKSKFLIPLYMNINQLRNVLRNKLLLSKSQSLFFLIDGKKAITDNCLISELYNKFKNEDGFLYLTYTTELIWGNNNLRDESL